MLLLQHLIHQVSIINASLKLTSTKRKAVFAFVISTTPKSRSSSTNGFPRRLLTTPNPNRNRVPRLSPIRHLLL
ncbi:hypothetical protein OPV22_017134 [Ensete ventricosum]|uniref:Uncharacterized protein n=1 Tax=Ensete ventricosum TaxID=4639 RepID=A0AAV8R1E1_ENSVE|nr:hypothetical protein OPV22_017134 [Ensete ventricosum]